MPRNVTKRHSQPRLSRTAQLQAPRPKKVANATSWAVYLTWAKGGVYLGDDGIYLGRVEAGDEIEAREKAIKLYNTRESKGFRLNIKGE
jgi:hypothetical protein